MLHCRASAQIPSSLSALDLALEAAYLLCCWRDSSDCRVIGSAGTVFQPALHILKWLTCSVVLLLHQLWHMGVAWCVSPLIMPVFATCLHFTVLPLVTLFFVAIFVVFNFSRLSLIYYLIFVVSKP